MNRIFTLLTVVATVIFITACSPPANTQSIPDHKGLVSDFTNTLTYNQRQDIEAKLRGIQSKANFVIAVFPNMGGDDISTFRNKVFTQWGIGKKGVDRGLLLVIAKSERKIGFEVGYGLEPDLPDMKTAQIRDKITPYLAKGDYYNAFKIAITEVDNMVK